MKGGSIISSPLKARRVGHSIVSASPSLSSPPERLRHQAEAAHARVRQSEALPIKLLEQELPLPQQFFGARGGFDLDLDGGGGRAAGSIGTLNPLDSKRHWGSSCSSEFCFRAHP